MILNDFERLLTNSPVRRFLQRRVEVPWFLRNGGPVTGGHVLEVGCGRGIGAGLILEQFGAARLDAFDLDPRMLARAKRRLARYGDRVCLWQGDATAIAATDDGYDAVFDFEIIHHVPDWRSALAEIFRVMKPGGRFYAGEILERFILNPLSARLFDHPMQDRFDHAAFCDGLAHAGFHLDAERGMAECVGWYVARKPPMATNRARELRS